MSSSVAVSAPGSVAVPGTAAAAPADNEAAQRTGKKGGALLAAVLLVLLVAAGVWGYTQWWAPRQEAQQAAQLKYNHCLDEVKAYAGTPSYEGRLAQCESLYTE
jgi:uncharacterized protein HemX